LAVCETFDVYFLVAKLNVESSISGQGFAGWTLMRSRWKHSKISTLKFETNINNLKKIEVLENLNLIIKVC
jgi:hypothetical protein